MLLLMCCEALLQQRVEVLFGLVSNQIDVETETRASYKVWVLSSCLSSPVFVSESDITCVQACS